MFQRLCVLLGILILFSVSTFAAAPRLINFQGKLTTAGGTPEIGSQNLTFRIYNVETAGASIWDETVNGIILDSAGQFSTVLGLGGSPSNLNINFSQPLWLQVEYGGQIFTPRQRLSSVPYALYAITAESLAGGITQEIINLTVNNNITVTGTGDSTFKGSVAIGTTDATSKLTVIGTAEMTGFKLTPGHNGYVLTSDTLGNGTWQASTGGGAGGGWTDDGTVVRLTTITDNVGIGTVDAGASKLKVQGAGEVTGALKIGAYTLPNTDGTAGQVLKTDGSGAVTWMNDNVGGGSGGGNISGSGTFNRVAKFTGTNDIGDSTITDNGSNVSIAGNLSNVSGNSNLFKNTSNSATSFQVQNAAGNSVLDIDTTNQRVGVGTTTPGSKLTVAGTIETVGTGGIKFPDGTIQTTKATGGGGISPEVDNLIVTNRLVASGEIIGKTIKTTGGGLECKMPTGVQSVTMGYNTNATGDWSTAIGENTTASTYGATAMGSNTTASGEYSTVMGRFSTASGYASMAVGQQASAIGPYSTAMGFLTKASGSSSVAMGYWFENPNDYSLGIGNLSLDILLNPNGNSWLNADTGNVGIGTTSPGSKLTVAGTIETTGGIKFPNGSIQTTAAGSSLWAATGEAIYNTNSGNVGIGTTSTTFGPTTYKLGVNGDVGIIGQLGCTGGIGTDGNIHAGGNVGIGTTSPLNKMDVAGGMVIGAGYAGTQTAEADGLVVQGVTLIGGTPSMLSGAPAGLMLGVNGVIGCMGDIDTQGSIYADNKCSFNGSQSEIYGNLYVHGTLGCSGNKPFIIDHPLDPKNMILRHVAIESPEMVDVYRGTIITDANGEATVELPKYFEAININYQYQLTTVGGYAPVYVKQEIKDNKFVIAGGKPGLKVCWMVTGARNDAYAQKNPMVVEEEKGSGTATIFKKGTYLYPEGFK